MGDLMKNPALLLLIATALVAGCSSGSNRPPTYPVSGTVTWKGKPVEAARVIFVPQSAVEAAAGITDAEGKYRLTTFVAGDGAQAGEYRVKVTQYDTQKFTKEDQQKHVMTMEEEQKMVFPPNDLPIPPAKNLLPKKYESEATSGIVHTVTKGPTTLDIVIE